MSAEPTRIAVIADTSADTRSLTRALGAAGFDVELHAPGQWPKGDGSNARWVVFDAPTSVAMLRESTSLRDELAKVRTELEERKLVERAKGLLMTRRGLNEPDAYRTLQKMAMDRKRKLADIARNVLDFAELLGGPNDPTR